VEISQVVGLSSDLSAINSSLTTLNSVAQGLNSLISGLTNTVNNLSNTVGSLTSSAAYANFIDDETPTGTVNGTNAVFTLANIPVPSSDVSLYRNGVLLAIGVDYTMAGNTMTFSANAVPQTGDELAAYYRTAGTGSPSNFVDAETPAGTINGTNLSFSLANLPNPATSLKLFKNGNLLGQNVDYTLSNQTITFINTAVTPLTGDSLAAYYRTTIQSLNSAVSRDESVPARQDY
jgi:hypothetical protein